MTAVSWVFRKHWHPERKRLARLRALWLILTGYETEICGRCGWKVGLVWRAPDEVWLAGNGLPDEWGVLCIRCFDLLAARRGLSLWWECAVDVYPSCAGSPCGHLEAMMTIAEQRDGLWRELGELRAPGQLVRAAARALGKLKREYDRGAGDAAPGENWSEGEALRDALEPFGGLLPIETRREIGLDAPDLGKPIGDEPGPEGPEDGP